MSILNVNGYDVLLSFSEGNVLENIEIKLTREERRQALLKLSDDKINFKNSAYTYVFQGYLAKYMGESTHEMRALEKNSPRATSDDVGNANNFASENLGHEYSIIQESQNLAKQLHHLSTCFIPLENFINNAAIYKTENFPQKFEEFKQKIKDYIDKLNWDTKISSKLKDKILRNIDNFEVQILKLKNKPNKYDLDCLLSIADRSLSIKSLGTFMQEQMTFILDAGIKKSYKISGNRLRDLVQVPRLVAYLSDAKHLMLIKGQSIVEGPKDNNTYTPIPKEMLDALTDVKIIEGEDKLYFSLMPYLKKTHPKYLDEILCLVINKSRDDNNLYENYFYHCFLQPLKLLACVVELAFAIPRILLVLALGVIEAIFSSIGFFLKLPKNIDLPKVISAINFYITSLYEVWGYILTPLNYLQNTKANHYSRKDSEGNHQKVLDACADYSSYSAKLFKYFTPHLVCLYIQGFFTSIIASIKNFLGDLKYLCSPNRNNEEIFEKIQQRCKLVAIMKEVFEQAKAESSENVPNTQDKFADVVYCDGNDIVSPLDVFYEIAVVLSNGVVNPMFRKSPGLADFYFALSLLTFGFMVLPTTAFVAMQPVSTWLTYVADKISINFTGKSIAAGPMEKLIACFLGWKLGFFSSELIVELMAGHYAILEKLFEEPEQIVLGLVGLVGTGMGLQFIPNLPSTIKIFEGVEIPNPYFIIINTFTEEAKSCAEATLGFNSIEYGFLGLKFGMLIHSMLSNSTHKRSEFDKFKNIISALMKNNFFNKLMAFCKDKQITADNLKSAEFIKKLQEFFKGEFSASKLELNELENFTALFVNKYTFPEQNKVKNSNLDFQLARQELLDAMQIFAIKDNNLLFSRPVFGVNKEAQQLYDKLDSLFDKYNNALRAYNTKNYSEYYIDKRPFLDVFFNKYVYKSSNNFVRSFILIFYPLTLISRTLKYLWALFANKPSMQHQIIKNFCKDLVILSQIFTPIARMIADFNLYLTGILRAVAFIIIVPIAGLILYPIYEAYRYFNTGKQQQYTRELFSKWFAKIDEFICEYIALHKTPALQPIRQLIVRASRVAGVNANLQAEAKKVLLELNCPHEESDKNATVSSFSPSCVS